MVSTDTVNCQVMKMFLRGIFQRKERNERNITKRFRLKNWTCEWKRLWVVSSSANCFLVGHTHAHWQSLQKQFTTAWSLKHGEQKVCLQLCAKIATNTASWELENSRATLSTKRKRRNMIRLWPQTLVRYFRVCRLHWSVLPRSIQRKTGDSQFEFFYHTEWTFNVFSAFQLFHLASTKSWRLLGNTHGNMILPAKSHHHWRKGLGNVWEQWGRRHNFDYF